MSNYLPGHIPHQLKQQQANRAREKEGERRKEKIPGLRHKRKQQKGIKPVRCPERTLNCKSKGGLFISIISQSIPTVFGIHNSFRSARTGSPARTWSTISEPFVNLRILSAESDLSSLSLVVTLLYPGTLMTNCDTAWQIPWLWYYFPPKSSAYYRNVHAQPPKKNLYANILWRNSNCCITFTVRIFHV